MACNCMCSVNDITSELLNEYKEYREHNQILCNFLMSYFDNWQINIVEHDVNVFRLNFCSRSDRMNDTSFLVSRDQLANFKCILEDVIIPTLVKIEHDAFGDCECQM